MKTYTLLRELHCLHREQRSSFRMNKRKKNVLPLWNALISESAYVHFRRSTAPDTIWSCEPPLFSNILTTDYCDRSLRLNEVQRKIFGKRSFLNEARSAEAKKLERDETDTTWLIWCGPQQLVTEVKYHRNFQCNRRMGDLASLGFRGLDLRLNLPKPLPVLRSHATIPRFTSFPSPAVALHIARRWVIENHISVHENNAFPQLL